MIKSRVKPALLAAYKAGISRFTRSIGPFQYVHTGIENIQLEEVLKDIDRGKFDDNIPVPGKTPTFWQVVSCKPGYMAETGRLDSLEDALAVYDEMANPELLISEYKRESDSTCTWIRDFKIHDAAEEGL